MTIILVVLVVVVMTLCGCGRRGDDNPGGYSDAFWADRQAKRDFAHRPGKGRRDNMWALALFGARPSRKRTERET